MWDIENQDIVVLVSVISAGCAIILNVWGSFVALTLTLGLIVIIIIIIFAWWCAYDHRHHRTNTITDNSTPFFIAPHALLALDYLEQTGSELNTFVKKIYNQIFRYSYIIGDKIYQLYDKHIIDKMAAQRRRNTYQLSAEQTTNYTKNSQNSTRFNLVDGQQLSPIPRLVTSTFTPGGAAAARYNLENMNNYSRTDLRENDSRIFEGHQQVTSTPLISSSSSSSSLLFLRKENTSNGHPPFDRSPINTNSWKNSHSSLVQNHTLSRGDDASFSHIEQSSPWGTSISPKMRARAGGIKTVQTVAGPLLASTRYNIDPKVYSDVTSPGLTTRLTKYATEANMKLTHQSQYGTGQFPRVNLSSSPTPLINTKTGKMRMPVTVRVAPPENTTRYSPPERQQILSDICHVEKNKGGLSVVQVLREISLKRHASREDVTFDIAKKQRTEGVFSDGLENLEEMTQKRGRDESLRSEEDSSPPNKVFGRPAKRSKTPSCCYDILSSLSSSINVTSGLKRKAIEPSETSDDVGKHFKSLEFGDECSDGIVNNQISRCVSEPVKKISAKLFNESVKLANSNLLNSQDIKNIDSTTKNIICSPGKEILNVRSQDKGGKKFFEILSHENRIRGREKITKFSSMPMKFTDKLFMKAEPESIDKLKNLIEEHGSIKTRFTTNDTDEIKKSDIVNMRQTSMKTRLKSMFDAISGKATSAINPEVVIQAEDSSKNLSSETNAASLNSSTWTTNINTSPIATSAIVPIIGKTKVTVTPAKHVTFQFKNVEKICEKATIDQSPTIIIDEKIKNNSNVAEELKKMEDPKMANTTTDSIFQISNSSLKKIDSSMASAVAVSSSSPSAFSIASPIFTNTSRSNDSTIPVSSSLISKKFPPPASLAMKIATTSPPEFNSTQVISSPTIASSLFGISTTTAVKSISSPLAGLSSTGKSIENNIQPPIVNFSFGAPTSESLTSPKSQESQNSSLLECNKISMTCSLPSAAAMTKSEIFGTSATSKPVYSFTSALNRPETTQFSFTGNASTPQTTDKKNFTFGATSAIIKAKESCPSIGTSPQPVTTTGSGFNFSTSSNATPTTSSNLFGTPTTSALSLGFATSTSTTTPAFTFGSNLTTAAAISKPAGFSFVTSAAPLATMAATTPASTSASTLSFGTTSNNTAIPLFGGPSTTSSSTIISSSGNTRAIFGASTTTSTGFVPSVTNSSAFGAAPSQSSSSFGSNSSVANTFGAPKTIETPNFGGTNNGGQVGAFPVISTTSGGLFSRVNSDTTTTNSGTTFGANNFGQTKAPPAFGASSSFSAVPSTNLFGTQPTTNAVSFGNSVNTGGGNNNSARATPIFGTSSNTLAPSFGISSTPAPSFGISSTPAASFGTSSTPAPSFGASDTPAPSFGASSTSTAVPTFGAPSTAPPPFGATNTSSTATTNNFGPVSTVSCTFTGNNTATSAFGGQNNAVPSSTVNTNTTGSNFGPVTTAPPAFPSSLTPQFGTSGTSNQPPAFTSANTNFTGFGASSTNAPSPFSNQTAPSTPAFGTSTSTANSSFATNNSTNNANTSFTFSQPAPQQTQQNAVFSFGGNPATSGNNSTSASAPFQFGSSAPQVGGFNFTGGSSTPALNFSKDGASGGSFGNIPAPGTNAFNSPATGGMFSIGTGSTAPRSRPSRRRQR